MVSSDPRAAEYFDRLKETLQDAGIVPRPPLLSTSFDWFQTAALRRLDRGAIEYGRDNYLRRDVNLADEAIEEMLDVAVYSLLELAKSNPDSCDSVPLGQAVFHAYRAYESLRDYKAKLRGSF